MTQQEYCQYPVWLPLIQTPQMNSIVLGISPGHDERPDYEMLCQRFGEYFQFLLLNDEAINAFSAIGTNLRVLGTIANDELRVKPSVLYRR